MKLSKALLIKLLTLSLTLRESEKREHEGITFTASTDEFKYEGYSISYHNGDSYDEVYVTIKNDAVQESVLTRINENLFVKCLTKAKEDIETVKREKARIALKIEAEALLRKHGIYILETIQ